MASLNPAQQEAVATLSGPLLVLAGAGSGKTRVVTARIANLIRHGAAPERILAVTFTNKAATEMQQRVREQLGRKLKGQPRVSTFHAHCVKVLRRHIVQLGYPPKFAIYDRGDQESLARSVLREIRVSGELLRPSDLLTAIGNWKTHAIRPAAAAANAGDDKEHLAAAAYRRYQRSLKNCGAVDFDDLLLLTEELFEKFPAVRREEAGRFDHLLIDEYQDTNASQYRIVKALAAGHRNLCVVGDDDQSIYGWRGAEVEHILRFARDWPDARVVRLEMNYRCTEEILQLANALIAFNKNRHEKVLRAARPGGEKPRILQFKDETEEAKAVVGDVLRQVQKPGVEARDIAILFRTNEQPRAFETELRKQNVPYKLIGGMSFFDRKEVRDVLAYLKVLDSPQDEVSLLRIINTPPRGLGQRSVETLLSHAVKQGQPIWRVLTQSPGEVKIPAAAKKGADGLVSLVRQFSRRMEKGNLAESARELVTRIKYYDEIVRLYPDPNEQQGRWAAVEEVINALAAYERGAKAPTLTEFLDETALDGREFDNDKEKQLRANAVVLMTLHSAKGLEFPQVYMVGLEEGILPHRRSEAMGDDAVSEERRLCYVGLTRAQERLTLTFAKTRMKWGKPRETIPSRFLYEIMGQAENPHLKKPGRRTPARPRG
ncbi:MAG: UvrD-helicase domain-containing protein [Planctomycetes bacterium]|nr:UvrD-helicase domain-containing protein [Planctomycetota bacterium]